MQIRKNPCHTLTQIPHELDQAGWQLAIDYVDIAVYFKKGASQSDVIGFKTVTYHSTDAVVLYDFLKDVNKAMYEMNDMFVLGEILTNWRIKEDENGAIVRTSFEMPFPFANREFIHGLHSMKLQNGSFVVAYTPADCAETAVQHGYVRCPMFTSGQRITALPNGLTRVEHLMTYILGGKISKGVQDKWLLKSHVGAYIKEWRKLRTIHFPATIMTVNYTQLKSILLDALQESDQWAVTKSIPEGTIKVGRLPYCPRNVYRTDTTINATLAQVVDVIADASLLYLPQWNKEFMNGEIIEVLEDTESKKAWLIRVHYATPFFLSNREYVYYFSREWLNDSEVLITYNSIKHDSAVPTGFVRALLHPSVHYCKQLPNGQTKIEHLLATDLGGKLSSKQDNLLKGGLVQAHCRDMQNQRKLFKKL